MTPTTLTTPRWRKLLPELAIVIAWLTAVIGFVWAMSADRADALGRVNAATLQVADHETRVRILERQIGEVAADVRWIRQTLEQQDLHASPGKP